MSKDFHRVNEVVPISVLAGIDGGKMYKKIRRIFSNKYCPLISKKGNNFRLLLVSAKLIKDGKGISREAICINCKFYATCKAQRN